MPLLARGVPTPLELDHLYGFALSFQEDPRYVIDLLEDCHASGISLDIVFEHLSSRTNDYGIEETQILNRKMLASRRITMAFQALEAGRLGDQLSEIGDFSYYLLKYDNLYRHLPRLDIPDLITPEQCGSDPAEVTRFFRIGLIG